MIIRNQKLARKGKKDRLQSFMIYSGVFVLVIVFIILGYSDTANPVPAEELAKQQQAVSTGDVSTDAISVDQLTAANAVTDLAEIIDLPSAGDLRESTATLTIKKEMAQTDATVISKPQIVKPETSANRGITSYVVKEGDTLETIARAHGVSSQTLRWANNTTSDAVEIGKTIVVPQVDGVVYTVKEGDTVAAIADKYKADANRIVLYNDIDETVALSKDMRIVLPGGELPENERPGYVAPRAATVTTGGSSLTVRNSYLSASVGNRYAAGNCTWYAYERRMALGRPIGSFWGNANTWAASARAAGFVVNNTPAPGAIFQTSSGGGGYGHVGIVERVENGVVYVSDMNYAGYGVVTHRTLPNPGSYNYIH